MGEESPERESRQTAGDRERADAKSKVRRQVRLPGQRRGDVVRDRRQVRYQDRGKEMWSGTEGRSGTRTEGRRCGQVKRRLGDKADSGKQVSLMI